jgi:hypothetical protein
LLEPTVKGASTVSNPPATESATAPSNAAPLPAALGDILPTLPTPAIGDAPSASENVAAAIAKNYTPVDSGSVKGVATTDTASAASTAVPASSLNLNASVETPVKQDTIACYDTHQGAEKVSFFLSGPVSRLLPASDPSGPLIFCCRLDIIDLPSGSYNLKVEYSRSGTSSSDNRTIVIEQPSKNEILTQQAAIIVSRICSGTGAQGLSECKESLLDKYAADVRCQDLDEQSCQSSIHQDHADEIIVLEEARANMAKNTKDLLGKNLPASEFEDKLRQGATIASSHVPLQDKNLHILVLGATADIVLDKTRGLVESAPLAIALDSDSDGLPDDTEKRLGTDPGRADTDGDGYPDGEEVGGGYNPQGGGKQESRLSPAERILLAGKSLGQPKTSGTEDANFSVGVVANIKSADGSDQAGKYLFSGKAQPDSLATLYIYSDIPLITTIATDQNGNWQYEFDQPLSDGDHEIFVAASDSEGRITNKSKPLDFIVQQAKAVSPTAANAPAATNTPAAPASQPLRKYLASAAMALATLAILFLAYRLLKKKRLL